LKVCACCPILGGVMTTQPTRYPAREERWHVRIHALGLMLAVLGLCGLLWRSWLNHDSWRLLASAVYGATLIFSFASSVGYHRSTDPERRRWWRHLDHLAIYLLIAGTYTPFLLVSLRGAWGWSLFVVIWALALVGIVQEFIQTRYGRRLSLVLYLGMGWIVVVAIQPMLERVPEPALWLLLAGGLLYSAGVAFYVRKSMPWHHVIWHLFVLLAALLHLAAVAIVIATPLV